MTSITSNTFPGSPASLALRLMLALSLLLMMGSPLAQPVLPPIQGDPVALPDNFDRVSFYLITVDVGNHIWDNFGHTALRVVDEESNTDLLFNWGLFDTSVGYVTFATNFIRGIMEYRLGVAPPAWELGRYRQEQRSVWQDRINLTAAQKETLYKRLAWNLREENIVYDYDYFFDNCTTRVRDYLNEAVQGQLQTQTTALSQRTFRDEVLDHYANVPGIDLSLDILMNEQVDQRMTQWEHMFLPAQLRRQLLDTSSAVFENGQRLPLLSDTQELMQFEAPQPGINIYYLVALLWLPLLLLLLRLRRNSIASFNSSPGLTFKSPGISYRVMGLLALLIALPSGIYGLMMSLGWAFSQHTIMHANVNLLLFWPTDLFLLLFALRWLISGCAIPLSTGKHQLFSLYLFAHLLAAVVYLLLGVTGLGGQQTGSLMLYAVPCLAVFTMLVWAAGTRRVRSIRFN